MVGTMNVVVARYRSAASRNAAGVNLGSTTLHAPLIRCGRKKAPLPWVIGAACSITEPGCRVGSRSTRKLVISANSVRLVSTTAFGVPVVPPV